ncbi:MAG: anti-sigma factor family protein [Georgenia sp.]
MFRSVMTRSRCHQVARVLQGYLDGELDVTRSRRAAEHLEVCRRCGLEADAYAAIKVAIGATGDELEPASADALARLRTFADDLAGSQP